MTIYPILTKKGNEKEKKYIGKAKETSFQLENGKKSLCGMELMG